MEPLGGLNRGSYLGFCRRVADLAIYARPGGGAISPVRWFAALKTRRRISRLYGCDHGQQVASRMGWVGAFARPYLPVQSASRGLNAQTTA